MADATKLRRLGAPPPVEEARVDLIPDPPEQEALREGQGGLLHDAGRVVAAVHHAPITGDELEQYGIDTRPKPRVSRVPMNHRVPEELAIALKKVAQIDEIPAQDILSRWMLRGLNEDYPHWRTLIRK